MKSIVGALPIQTLSICNGRDAVWWDLLSGDCFYSTLRAGNKPGSPGLKQITQIAVKRRAFLWKPRRTSSPFEFQALFLFHCVRQSEIKLKFQTATDALMTTETGRADNLPEEQDQDRIVVVSDFQEQLVSLEHEFSRALQALKEADEDLTSSTLDHVLLLDSAAELTQVCTPDWSLRQ